MAKVTMSVNTAKKNVIICRNFVEAISSIGKKSQMKWSIIFDSQKSSWRPILTEGQTTRKAASQELISS